MQLRHPLGAFRCGLQWLYGRVLTRYLILLNRFINFLSPCLRSSLSSIYGTRSRIPSLRKFNLPLDSISLYRSYLLDSCLSPFHSHLAMGHSTRRVNSNSRNAECRDLDWRLLSGDSMISDAFVSDLFPNLHPTGWSTNATRAPSMQTLMMSPSLGQSYPGQSYPVAGPSGRRPAQPGSVVDHSTPRIGSFAGQTPFQGRENLPHQTSSPEQITLTEHEFFSFDSSERHPSFPGPAPTANDPNTTETASRGGRGQRGRSSRYTSDIYLVSIICIY